MTPDEADELLADAPIQPGGVWADFGAGTGVFTRALARRLGPGGTVYAVDRDRSALGQIGREPREGEARVIPVVADFDLQFEAPGSGSRRMDGMLFANSLHYIADPAIVLGRLATWIAPGGLIVVIEYDRRRANPWVPYPIPIASLAAIATRAEIETPTVIARRPSAYEGEIYAAVMRRSNDSNR